MQSTQSVDQHTNMLWAKYATQLVLCCGSALNALPQHSTALRNKGTAPPRDPALNKIASLAAQPLDPPVCEWCHYQAAAGSKVLIAIFCLCIHHPHHNALGLARGLARRLLPVHAQLAEPAEVLRLSFNAFCSQQGHHITCVDIHHDQRAQCRPADTQSAPLNQYIDMWQTRSSDIYSAAAPSWLMTGWVKHA